METTFGSGIGIQDSDLNQTSEQLPSCFFNPNCENSIDQKDLFESTLSSIVSSPPVNSHPGIPIPIPGGDDNIVLSNGNNTCYDTPLNSPPKLNLSIKHHKIQANCQFPFPEDSGFVERAAKFSTFCVLPHGIESEIKKLGDSNSIEEPSVSETGTKGQSANNNNDSNSNGRKRKGVPKGKDDKVVAEAEKEDSDAKRSKSMEPPKDYIHVRARRGQATDSHSLAERVRREKISERMKFLQDLVPGCNKVTGKAVMLDEIINYVQSLQRQVEFLSMKLATVNPRMDVSMEALLSKNMLRPLVPVPNNVSPFDASVQPFLYGFQSQMNSIVPEGPENQFLVNPLMTAVNRNSNIKPSHIDGFNEVSTFWENDLQSVVKMAKGQDQPQSFPGQMKVEL